MVTISSAHLRHLLSGILLLLTAVTVRAELTASLDRTEVQQGETLTLTITALLKDTPFSLFDLNTLKVPQPDTSALARDFEILGQDQRYSMQFTNNVSETRIFWEYTLLPRRVGEIDIPPILWRKEKTPALKVTVRDAPATPQSDAPVRIEAELDASEAYVGEQRILNLRLLYREDMARGQWSHPDSPDLTIRQLGSQTEFTRLINGKAYHGLARRYALFPRKPGTLTIPSVSFEGLLIHDVRKTLTKRTAVSPELTLRVKPVPPNAPQPWLPARRMHLSETWTPDQATLRVGDSLTRDIRLEALGLDAADLPDISVPTLPEGIRIYPQPARRDTRESANGLTGKVSTSWAIVPARPGTYRLPEINIRYWNTVKDQSETVTLPARTIEVTGTGMLPAGASATLTPEKEKAPDTTVWKTVAVVLGLCWIATLGGLWYVRTRKALPPSTWEPRASHSTTLSAPPRITRDVQTFLREAELWLEYAAPLARRHDDTAPLLTEIRERLNSLASHCYGEEAGKAPGLTSTRAVQHAMQMLYKRLLSHLQGNETDDWLNTTQS